MNRNLAEDIMLKTFEVAQNSTCARRRVGAIITTPDGQLISTGWNHSTNGISCEAKFFEAYVRLLGLSDLPEYKDFLYLLQNSPRIAHEQEDFLPSDLLTLWNNFREYTKTDEFKKEHWNFMGQEIHSEVHAVLNALKNHQVIENCILFSSRSPCEDCAKVILEVGIKKVYYTETSEKGLSGGLSLLDSRIELEHLPVETKLYT